MDFLDHGIMGQNVGVDQRIALQAAEIMGSWDHGRVMSTTCWKIGH
jgi:hypothetical protein